MRKNEDVIKRYLREEFEKEAKETLEEVEKDKELNSVKVPDEMYEQLMVKITTLEQEKAASKELDDSCEVPKYAKIMRFSKKKLGRLVATAAVLVLCAGITSVGGPQYILETVRQKVGDREITKMNPKDTEKIKADLRTEEEAFEKVKNMLGIEPVRLNYLPAGTEFRKCEIIDELFLAKLEFSYNEKILMYQVQANYTETYYGVDIEDKLIDEWEILTSGTTISIRQYLIEETGETEYVALFKYNNMEYSFKGILPKDEFEKILQNLYFL